MVDYLRWPFLSYRFLTRDPCGRVTPTFLLYLDCFLCFLLIGHSSLFVDLSSLSSFSTHFLLHQVVRVVTTRQLIHSWTGDLNRSFSYSRRDLVFTSSRTPAFGLSSLDSSLTFHLCTSVPRDSEGTHQNDILFSLTSLPRPPVSLRPHRPPSVS